MNNPNPNQHDFDAIFRVHSKNPEATKALEILRPYFPYLRDTRNLIDINTLWQNGGTFLSNWNLVPREATCAVRVLNELSTRHDCFFIVPIGSPQGVPDAHIPEMTQRTASCMNQITWYCLHGQERHLSEIPLPLYFSVHTYSRNESCAITYRDTAMACVLEDIPDIALHKEFSDDAESFTTNYLKGFTLSKNADD